jgi:hypothetical protein
VALRRICNRSFLVSISRSERVAANFAFTRGALVAVLSPCVLRKPHSPRELREESASKPLRVGEKGGRVAGGRWML